MIIRVYRIFYNEIWFLLFKIFGYTLFMWIRFVMGIRFNDNFDNFLKISGYLNG